MKECYRVVIVDDEPAIVTGLSRMIDWKSFNCEVAGTADSGQEGIRVIDDVKPDILFTDIQMPGIDGLTMIAALKSEHKDMEITILTGYRDFEYARQAITLGVHRFLLKPSRMDELSEAIQSMVEKLDSRAIRDVSADDETQTGEASSAGNFIVDSALSYMRENYTEKLQLADVAEHVYVSVWHLSKLLNSVTGKNFSELLNGIRIEKAKELLPDPSLHVADIAEKVGFIDMAHFSRVFKRITGMSANEYRNNRKKE
ncbi:MAG: response regulator [Lachnospiraceae bacterium]|nr:response regulator [Lachnospiraceae bacterium]